MKELEEVISKLEAWAEYEENKLASFRYSTAEKEDALNTAANYHALVTKLNHVLKTMVAR